MKQHNRKANRKDDQVSIHISFVSFAALDDIRMVVDIVLSIGGSRAGVSANVVGFLIEIASRLPLESEGRMNWSGDGFGSRREELDAVILQRNRFRLGSIWRGLASTAGTPGMEPR
jgi:hypothetical protein